MRDTIAIVFDFDETLAPDSTTGFLKRLGVDVGEFWQRANGRILEGGWDPIPVYLYGMLEVSNSGNPDLEITREKLAAFGGEISYFKGVTTLFKRLRTYVESLNPNVKIEFYLISSGIGEILRGSRIARHFTDIWACDFEYDDAGRIVFPKNVVSFTEKTRFLFNISKGLIGARSRTRPADVNLKVPAGEFRVPFDHMIFVGDGYTDIPCFTLLRRYKGVALGVYDSHNPRRWEQAWGFIEDDRVSSLLPADYRTDSAVESQLKMAISSIVRRL